MSGPTPISPSTVHIILQYIAPPSQLLHPLPPYLLSKPLLQRHHFLDISPQEPHEYLCWPSSLSTSLNAIHLLESLPRPLDDDVPISYPVQYASDDEHTCAHVHLTPTGDDGLRLVFQWDEHDGWKYHDASLMPFPTTGHPSLLDALKSQSRDGAHFNISESRLDHNLYGFNEDNGSDDDDDYWNAYGSQEVTGSSSGLLSLSAKDADTATEDAYWARYSSVHGTADSTRPSPRPIQRRGYPPFVSEIPTDPDSPHPLPVPVRIGSEDAIPIPHARPTTRAPWDPASPQTLARLLADISPRHSPAVISHADDESDTLSPAFESSGSDEQLDTPSPNGLGLTEDGHSLVSPTSNGIVETPGLQSRDEADSADIDATEVALRDSIRGLYALWRTSQRKGGLLSGESDRDAFIRIVEDVVV